MSEKEKMQTEELAKIMDDAKPFGKLALSFMAGFMQGCKETRKEMEIKKTQREQPREEKGEQEK